MRFLVFLFRCFSSFNMIFAVACFIGGIFMFTFAPSLILSWVSDLSLRSMPLMRDVRLFFLGGEAERWYPWIGAYLIFLSLHYVFVAGVWGGFAAMIQAWRNEKFVTSRLIDQARKLIKFLCLVLATNLVGFGAYWFSNADQLTTKLLLWFVQRSDSNPERQVASFARFFHQTVSPLELVQQGFFSLLCLNIFIVIPLLMVMIGFKYWAERVLALQDKNKALETDMSLTV
jgi:hypothetical protein